MENYYYEVLYDILKAPMNHTDKALKLKQLKAKLLHLTSNHRRDLLLISGAHATATSADSTLYHFIRSRKRQEQRTILAIRHVDDQQATTTPNIIRVVHHHCETKFAAISTDESSLQALTAHV
jgi:hypothetical protein